MRTARIVFLADAHVHPWRLQSRDGGHDRLLDGLSAVRQSLQLARELGPGKVVATVAVDTGLKYLAGDLHADCRCAR